MSNIITSIIIIIYLLFVVRAFYTFIIMDKASNMIHVYTNILIEIGEYERYTNYYKEYLLGFYEYLFKFWLWGVKNAIHPEKYRYMNYIIEEHKHIKSRKF